MIKCASPIGSHKSICSHFRDKNGRKHGGTLYVVPSAAHLKFEIYLDTMFRFLTFHSYQNLQNHINSNTMLSRPSTKTQNLPTRKRKPDHTIEVARRLAGTGEDMFAASGRNMRSWWQPAAAAQPSSQLLKLKNPRRVPKGRAPTATRSTSFNRHPPGPDASLPLTSRDPLTYCDSTYRPVCRRKRRSLCQDE